MPRNHGRRERRLGSFISCLALKINPHQSLYRFRDVGRIAHAPEFPQWIVRHQASPLTVVR